MVNKTTSAQLMIKTPQYAEESTEGTPPVSATFTQCGISTMASIKIDGQWVEVTQLGSEDILNMSQGQQKAELQLKMNIAASTFIKYGIAAQNYATPAGTISAPLTILFSFYLNAAENYIICKGARCKSITIACGIGKLIEVTMVFACMDISTPNTAHGLTSPTFASAITGPAWNWLSGGAAPVSWNSTGINCKQYSITINRNATEDYVIGQYTPYGILNHARKIGGSLDNLWTDTTLETDFKTPTARTLAIVLKSAISTITFTSASIVTWDIDEDESKNEAVAETVNFKAVSVAIT